MSTMPHPRAQRLVVGDPAAGPEATNIDRRQCSRVKPLRVICAGLSRTGTSSLRQALIDLGFDDCYHFSSILNENPRDAEMWVDALEAKYEGRGPEFERADWDQLLGHCMAVTDTPLNLFWRELMAAYPDAKVILTVRDNAEAYHESQMSTLQPYAAAMVPQSPTFLQRLGQLLSPKTAGERMLEILMRHHPMFLSGQYDLRHGTSTSIKMYEDWNTGVAGEVQAERLLVFNVKQGWKPLCGFLGVATPDAPFPRLNDANLFNSNLADRPAMLEAARRATVTKYLLGLGAVVLAAAVLIQYAIR